MMTTYTATVHINAPAEKIWGILVDGVNYPEWDPNMDRIEGDIKPGEKVNFYTKLSPNRAFPTTVTGFIPREKLVLTSRMLLGLFKSERVHSLKPSGDGIEFTTREELSGLLQSIPDLNETFEQFAQGLKDRSESA